MKKVLGIVCMLVCVLFINTGFTKEAFKAKYDSGEYIIDIDGIDYFISKDDEYDNKMQNIYPFTYKFSTEKRVIISYNSKKYELGKPKPKPDTSKTINEGQPFGVKYMGSGTNKFRITINNKHYYIVKGDRYDGYVNKVYPFNYKFEPDGDVDIYYRGQTYDIDNPDDDAADAVEDVLKAFFK